MAEKRVIELEVKDNVQSLKSQLREATAQVALMAEKYGATSVEAANAAKKAAELKDMIADAKDLTDAFNPDAKFNALSNSIGGVLNGFQAYEGALGLVGVESKDLQETLLKVQSAMALSQGLQGVLEAKDNFVQLGSVVKNVFSGMTTSTKIFLATGLGLLLVGLQQLIANWDKVKASIGSATEAQRINNEVKVKALESISKELSASNKLSESLKDENLSRDEKVKLIKEFQADYPGLLKNINLEKDSIKQINKQLSDNVELLQLQAQAKALASVREETYAKKTKLQLELQQEGIENATRWTLDFGDAAENGWVGFSTATENAALATKNLNEIQNSSTKTLDNQIKTLDKTEKAIQKKIDALKKSGASTGEVSKAEEQAEELAKKRAEQQKQRSADKLQQLKAELDAQIELEIRKNNTSEKILRQLLDKRLALEKLSGNQLLLAKEQNEEKIRQAVVNDNQKLDKLEIKKVDTAKDLNFVKYENLKGALNLEVEAEQDAANKKQDILDAQALRAKRLDEQANSFKIKSIQSSLSIISDLTELFGKKGEAQAKKAFQVQKAVNIASALISTYTSASAAYQSQFTPVPDPSSPVRGGIAAGLAVAAGLTNVAKISAQQFNSPSISSSTPSGGGTITAPNFNVVGNTNYNQLAQLQQPIKAYVVSNEITTAQAWERNVLQKSSL